MVSITLKIVKRTHPLLLQVMAVHYSQPKGFVGRNICYKVENYGFIVAGSATRFLPGRNEFLPFSLNNIVNNIFFHVQGPYPKRNFVPAIIKEWRELVQWDWTVKYGDKVLGFETLVELPRTGECYKRDGWTVVGTTKGFTCKRIAGRGTDSWSGKRVWNTTELRPKLVLCRLP